MKFATYNRDGFTGMDYADQRYYASSDGRFNTPDRMAGSANPMNPASWNRYAYVNGDPINGFDPSGLVDRSVGSSANLLGACGGDPPGSGDGGDGGDGYGESREHNQICAAPNPGDGGGGGSSKQWTAAEAKLYTATHLMAGVLDGTVAPPCQADLGALGVAASAIVEAVYDQTWNDASTASVSESGLFTAQGDPNAYAFYSANPNLTVAGIMSGNSGIEVQAALPGSTLAGNVYFNAQFVNGLSNTNIAALRMHEALHTLGLTDTTVQTALGLGDGATDNITQKFLTDCFKGY